MTLSERVIARLLDTHKLVPPFRVLFNYDKLCMEYGHNDAHTVEAFYSILSIITRHLPDEYKITEAQLRDEVNAGFVAHSMTIPMHNVLDVKRVIVEILWQFTRELGSEHYSLRKQLLDNENSYHKISPYERLKKYIPAPTDIDEEPEELIRIYLSGTIFYEFLQYTQVQFRIPKKALSEHFFACAKQGHGKTVLLSNLVAQFLQDPEQPGLFILDPAGDWFEQLKPRIPPERLVVLDPETDPPPLNFFDFKNTTSADALQAFRYLMSTLTGGLSDKQNNITPYILRLLEKVEKPSLTALRKIMDERVKKPQDSKFFYAIEQLEDDDKDFFLNQFYNPDMNPTKNAISVKIYGAMGSDAFKKMFTADHNSFDARAAMEGQKVVLARGSENTLGEYGLPIFMQFIVSQIFMAALARFRIPEHKRKQCYLICDEASHIYNHQSTRLLVEARKLKLSFFSATQMLDQIPDEVKAAVNGNTSIKAAGWLQFSNANMMAREMRGTTGQAIQNLNTLEWIFQIANAERAMKVHVPYGALEKIAKQERLVQAAQEPAKWVPSTLPQTHEDHDKRGPRVILPPEGDKASIAEDDDIPTSSPRKTKK